MSETDGLLVSRFKNLPTMLVLENRTSEPRDALLSERTTLSWIRFAGTLALSSVAIMLNYRFQTDGSDNNNNGSHNFTKSSGYIITIGVTFSVLSLCSIILGGYNYFQTVNHCISQKIKIFDSRPTLLLLTLIVTVMLVVSITLIVDEI